MIIDNYDIEILEKWEMEWKPEWYELEKRANDVADAEIDKKFNRFNPFYYWLICNSYIMALIGSVAFLILDLIMWIFRNVIFLIFIFVTDYLIKKETWISLLKIISPSLLFSSPASIDNNVDFPQPEVPIIDTNSFSFIDKEILSMARISPFESW